MPIFLEANLTCLMLVRLFGAWTGVLYTQKNVQVHSHIHDSILTP